MMCRQGTYSFLFDFTCLFYLFVDVLMYTYVILRDHFWYLSLFTLASQQCPAAQPGRNPHTTSLLHFALTNPLRTIPDQLYLLPPQRSLDSALLRALDDMSFVPAILHQDALSHFVLPKFQMYDGLEDLFDHLIHFRQIMMLQTGNNALLCKVFPSYLVGLALSWFHRLSPNTVTSFRCLSEKFVTQYMCLVSKKQSVTSLFHVWMRNLNP